MSEHSDMGCGEFADVAAELALGVLMGRERAGALAHLERCDACRETVRQLTMTGEQLLELLPAVEPPAGFESRTMARLGIAVPDVPPPGHARTAGRPVSRPGTGRRALATLAAALALVAAALGGWAAHDVTSPARQSALSSATLLSAAHQDVGQIYYYNSSGHWIYMAVDMPSGDGVITCELEGPNGHYTAVGKFRLTQGHGAWGSPAPWSDGKVTGARLLASTGTVIATAAFH